MKSLDAGNCGKDNTALFVIQYVNLCQQSGSSSLIGSQLEVGVASYFIQHDKG